MSRDIKYIGMNVHKEAVVITVLNSGGKLVMESIVETKASSILQFIDGLRGELQVTWEEGLGGLALRSAATPSGASAGLRSAAQCLIEGREQERQGRRAQTGRLVAHGNAAPGLSWGTRTADAARVGAQLSDPQPRPEPSDESDQSSVSRLEHSLCRYPGVCSARYREEWLQKIEHAGVHRRAELLYQQLDGLQGLRRTLRPELLAESRKQPRFHCLQGTHAASSRSHARVRN